MNPTFQLKGRVDAIQPHEGAYFHIITTPAPDAYTKPSRYRLRSQHQLANVGSEIIVDVTISGSVFEEPYVDKKTGLHKVYLKANVYLDATPANLNRQAQPASKIA